MLSPCIRQVTHALLTRPPLKFKSLGFIKLPFDLHVLSTPPAFILSQDQTLMLYYLFACRFKLLRKIHLFVLPVLSGITVLFGLRFFIACFCSLNYSCASASFRNFSLPALGTFGIFRVALLFICQGSHGLCFLSVLLLSSAATLL